jgi:hypothetical protein
MEAEAEEDVMDVVVAAVAAVVVEDAEETRTSGFPSPSWAVW